MNRAYNQEILHRIQGRLQNLYPGQDIEALMGRLDAMLGRYEIGLTEREKPASMWSEKDAVLITYGDSVIEEGEYPLETLKKLVDRHLRDAVSIVHILPFFPYSSDDGFSVINYRRVRSDLGEWEDVRAVGEHAALMYDLVINHVSRKSEWFKYYVLDVAPYRDYFIEVEDGTDVSRVVRPRDLPLLTEVSKQGEPKKLWTTFSRDQIDLNFANPDVLFEFLDILFYYIAQKVRVIRLDAIAYLWKTPGTECIHLPQTHEVVKVMRDMVELVAPDVIILTETNVPHAENVSYFGRGDEAHMVYQFSLPPLLLHTLLKGSSRALVRWASRLAPPPAGCTFFNFTASHDGIGVRPLEGLVDEASFAELASAVEARGGLVSSRRKADGTTSPYELNITYFSALGPAGGEQDPLHIDRFLCSQIMTAGLQGIPAFYLHTWTASENDLDGVAATGRARSINRRSWPMPELEAKLADPASAAAQVFARLKEVLGIRAAHPVFHPDAAQKVVPVNDTCFCFLRIRPETGERLLAVHNVTGDALTVPFPASVSPDTLEYDDLLNGGEVIDASGGIPLKPYQCRWLVISSGKAAMPSGSLT